MQIPYETHEKDRQITNQKCHINPVSLEGASLDGYKTGD